MTIALIALVIATLLIDVWGLIITPVLVKLALLGN